MSDLLLAAGDAMAEEIKGMISEFAAEMPEWSRCVRDWELAKQGQEYTDEAEDEDEDEEASDE